jgi:ligand-binding sensor domain-containing protein/signal transduction histidine kinase
MPLRLCLVLTLVVASLPAYRLPIKVYTTAHGLPRNSARCIVPDSNGLLWLCTSEGLVRFDGYQFAIFGPEHGLPSRSILDFVLSRKGGYWVVTDAGVCRLPAGSKIGGRCRPLSVEGPTGDYQPDCLVESPDGRAWVATTSGLFRVSDNGLRLEKTPLETPAPSERINSIAAAPDGSLVAAGNAAVYYWKPGQPPRNITARFPRFTGASQIAAFGNHEIWMLANGLYRLDGWDAAQAPTVERFDYPRINFFSRILLRRDRSLWLAGSGILRVELAASGAVVESEIYSSREGLPGGRVQLLAEDSHGNLWGASDAAGVFRVTDSGFRVYNDDDGLHGARIASIFEDLHGDLCVTAGGASVGSRSNLRVKTGQRFEPINYRVGPGPFYNGWGWNQFGLQARDGEWWLPTGVGLFRFRNAAGPRDLNGRSPDVIYDDKTPARAREVFRVFEDSTGRIWFSTLSPTNGLVRWDRGTGVFRHWTAADGWPEDRVATVIRESASGTFWIATFGEILRFRNGRFELLPALPTAQIALVRDLFIDHAGRVWVATARYGLYRCDNPESPKPVFRNFTTRDGLASDSIRSIVEDAAGFIYAGTVRGIDRIDPQMGAGGLRIRHFTSDDGLPDTEQNVAHRDRNGRLWFGTLDGLVEFDPSKAARLDPPQVYVTRFRVRGEDVPLPWEGARSLQADLAADKNQFEIEFAGIDLRSVSSLRYQFRLAGLDRDWSPPADHRSVNFAGLPPGPFRFELRAVTADGQTGTSLTGFQIAIAAPLWQRWWFLALAAALTGAAAARLHSYRVRNLLAMERLRTRIAADLHDDIGSSLTQISILSELAGRGASREVLADIGGIARRLVQEMSDIVWAVNPRHDRFEELTYRMRHFAAATLGDLDLRFEADGLLPDFYLPLESRRPLYLVFKEAAHNIARHSGATRALIQLESDGASLKLIVEDNGSGIPIAAGSRGEGLNSIRRRMRDIGGVARWEPAAAGGTRFTAEFPLHSSGRLPKLRGFFARTTR